jgi:hypothetical protein
MKLNKQFELQTFGVTPKEGRRPTYECGYIGHDDEGLFYDECFDKYNKGNIIESRLESLVRNFSLFNPGEQLYLGVVHHTDTRKKTVLNGFILHTGTGKYYEWLVVNKKPLAENSIKYTLKQLVNEHK